MAGDTRPSQRMAVRPLSPLAHRAVGVGRLIMSGCCGPITGSGTVVFSYTEWIARYPEFQTITQPTAQAYFNEACLYLDNSPCSAVFNSAQGGPRDLILNMLTAHIAALNANLPGQQSSPLVGRISDATQGSVSVSADMGTVPFTAAWFMQTKYGAAAYQALKVYRIGFYTPGPRPYLGVSRAGYGGWGGYTGGWR